VIRSNEFLRGDASLFVPYGLSIDPIQPQRSYSVHIDPDRHFVASFSGYPDDLLIDERLRLNVGNCRAARLERRLGNTQRYIDRLSVLDPSWKVPKLDVKALRQNGEFSG
jgi:hypothetical protein